MIVSCDASSKFHRKKLPKRAFRAKLPTIFTEEGSKMIVSCEASSKFHKRSFQNDRFVRGFFKISPEKASKTSVSCEVSYNVHRRRFQNDRFVRGLLEISQKKVPKRAFRARRLQNFTQEASKIIVSCEASKFHRTSFQNDRFVRGFLKISQKKLPKRAFRAKLPTIFTEEGSKMIVSCEASSEFHKRSFQNDRFVRGFLQIS